MHLGIDRAQDADSGYEFPWTPATGNLLYCMPEKGQRRQCILAVPMKRQAA